jgi:hypothetical protein
VVAFQSPFDLQNVQRWFSEIFRGVPRGKVGGRLRGRVITKNSEIRRASL